MQVEYQDIALWYGTPDAPAPSGFIQAGAETTITVGVQPADASNHIEVRYRINQRSTETIAARWLWNDSSGKIQYFKVRLPPFRVGDVVEYTAICYCAGRQVPPPEEAKQFASSFHVIGAETKQTQGRPSGSPARLLDSSPSIQSFRNDQREHTSPRKLCTPRPRSEGADRQRLIEQFKQLNPIPLWRWSLSNQGIIGTLIPSPQPSQHLLDMGISFQLFGFPAGFKETDLSNYDQIVDAFSHCFYPGLFAALNIPDPYAAWPYQQTYWDGLFKIVSPAGFLVQVTNSNGKICFGVDGQVQESPGSLPFMQIYDCTPAPDVFHEIGHVVMDYGILGRIPPVYYRYATGNPARMIDAVEELNRLFGNNSEHPNGFVSDYAMTNQQEDFAETFKYYVYVPDEAFRRAAQQQTQGSQLLVDKLEYIAYLFKGMTFRPGGVVDSWPGYPL